MSSKGFFLLLLWLLWAALLPGRPSRLSTTPFEPPIRWRRRCKQTYSSSMLRYFSSFLLPTSVPSYHTLAPRYSLLHSSTSALFELTWLLCADCFLGWFAFRLSVYPSVVLLLSSAEQLWSYWRAFDVFILLCMRLLSPHGRPVLLSA